MSLMAPAKKSTKANAEPSKHNIMSFFGSAQSQGAPSRSQSEAKVAAKPKREPKATLTKVESEDQEDVKATPKFKCATFFKFYA